MFRRIAASLVKCAGQRSKVTLPPMRRSEKFIDDVQHRIEILESTPIANIAIFDSGLDVPYVFPVNHLYYEGSLYFHSGPYGRKMDLIKGEDQLTAAFVVSVLDEMHVNIESPCDSACDYQSVMGVGPISAVLDDEPEMRQFILERLMDFQLGFDSKHEGLDSVGWDLGPMIDSVNLVQIEISDWHAKVSPAPEDDDAY